MKKDKILTLMLGMVLIIFCFIVYINDFVLLNNDIYNKKWYSYDSTNGVYKNLEIKENIILLDGFSNFLNCSKYVYNKKDKIFNLNCNKKIKYHNYDGNKLLLGVDNKELSFFESAEEAYNYEFNKYFGLSVSDYIFEYNQVKELTLINYVNLIERINSGETFAIIFEGDNCVNNECYIFDKSIEKLIVKNSNIYTFDSTTLNDQQIFKLFKIDENFINDNDFYNSNYPRVVILSEGQVLETFLVMCEGFNCSKYNNILDTAY